MFYSNTSKCYKVTNSLVSVSKDLKNIDVGYNWIKTLGGFVVRSLKKHLNYIDLIQINNDLKSIQRQ